MRDRAHYLVPCTPLGCMELLSRSGIDVRGLSCVVVGDSNVVGTPLAVMMRDRGAAAVTICHRLSYQEWVGVCDEGGWPLRGRSEDKG
jgi:methylenetetrahydrofolate dehydrogenase (NADP+)/methenyltetrahydrofolate cyclohydrolase